MGGDSTHIDPTSQVLVPTGQHSPYPRPRWISVPRFFLFFFAMGTPLYPVLFVSALLKHTLFTVDRGLLDPSFLLWYLPLSAVSIWAFVDMWKEDDFLRQQRLAKLRQPPKERWQEKLAAARAKGDRRAELEALSNIGFWLIDGDRYEEAAPYLEEALALARELGDYPFEEEQALYGLGQVAFQRGDLDAAEDLVRECLAVVTRLGPERRGEIADQYIHVGEFLCQYRDKREEGCQMLAKGEAIYREIGQTKAHWLKYAQYLRDLRRQYGDESA